MLIRFLVSNFMSFKEETEFNMLTGKGKGYKQHPDHIYTTNSGVEILKTAAIYGANASGKSNLIAAIEYLKNTVLGANKDLLVPLSQRFRLDEEYKKKATTFRIEINYKEVHFDYAIEIERGKIKEEWLYEILSVEKGEDILLFNRKNKTVIFGDFFKNNNIDISYIEKYIEKELDETQCVLNAMYTRIDDNDKIDIIYEGLQNLCVVTPHSYNTIYPYHIMTDPQSKEFAENILKNSNTGIEYLEIQEVEVDKFFNHDDADFKQSLIDKLENGDEDDSLLFRSGNEYYSLKKKDGNYIVSALKTKHFTSNSLFDFSEESDGTNRLFELIPAFDELTKETDAVYIIDELERSMHPVLAKELLKLYVGCTNANSQLIFSTHETHILDLELLRQDEIWFTEKKLDGSSTFYPLSDFSPREDKNVRKGYLEGRYGGIPFLGDFNKLNITSDDSQKVY